MGEACSCLRKAPDSGEVKLTEQKKSQMSASTRQDKITMVIKIQAAFRGYLSRKYVRAIRSQKEF